MDIDWMRPMMTVAAFATFVGIVAWAWSARKQSDFEAAARSVLEDDEAATRFGNPVMARGNDE